MGITYEDINIIHEDNHILVVVKPQNVPTQEDASGDVSMQSLLKEYLRAAYKKPGEAYLGTVHRLDRPTGGVMVFAKTSKAAARLSEALREKAEKSLIQDEDAGFHAGQRGNSNTFITVADKPPFEKIYYVIVTGILKEKDGVLVHYLKKNTAKNVVAAVPMATDGAQRAELSYKVLEEVGGFSLVRVNLITGRPHQIRVQFSAGGHPVFGDVKYGAPEKTRGGGLALWSTELKFYHPVTGERMVFKVFPPKELAPWKAFDLTRHLSQITF